MKKLNLFALLAMLFSISLFCACSSDDDETNDDGNDKNYAEMIVGKWQFTEGNHPEEFEPCDYQGWMEFLSDGSYKEYDKCQNRTVTGTWKINEEGKFVLKTNELPIALTITIKELTKDKLVFEQELFGHVSILTHKRLE
ncbi:lipocalin family protein [uncultured Bacteroides sp.]|uniref:lipocalin family protein n=1 Tax=uncultured Bacteroides sp. TaxID=162156 RepID=UPI000821AA9D|nr:lipocalin family protein [uncultured Bacteroides sp.]SCH14947.1 Uncharacterised protein [uncultured Bacteroides sp.]